MTVLDNRITYDKRKAVGPCIINKIRRDHLDRIGEL
jgi:hypothetical protein